MKLEKSLVGNGQIFREARIAKRPLTLGERVRVLRVRTEAEEAGLSQKYWKSLEWEGEMGEKGVTSFPTVARFIGTQRLSNHFTFRLYNIEGDHPLNNSTVSVTTLVVNFILPTDLTLIQIGKEFIREREFAVFCFIQDSTEKIVRILKGGK